MSRASRSSSAAKNGTLPDWAEAGEPWAKADLFFLKDALERGMSFAQVAGFLRRTVDEVQDKAKHLSSYSANDPERDPAPERGAH